MSTSSSYQKKNEIQLNDEVKIDKEEFDKINIEEKFFNNTPFDKKIKKKKKSKRNKKNARVESKGKLKRHHDADSLMDAFRSLNYKKLDDYKIGRENYLSKKYSAKKKGIALTKTKNFSFVHKYVTTEDHATLIFFLIGVEDKLKNIDENALSEQAKTINQTVESIPKKYKELEDKVFKSSSSQKNEFVSAKHYLDTLNSTFEKAMNPINNNLAECKKIKKNLLEQKTILKTWDRYILPVNKKHNYANALTNVKFYHKQHRFFIKKVEEGYKNQEKKFNEKKQFLNEKIKEITSNCTVLKEYKKKYAEIDTKINERRDAFYIYKNTCSSFPRLSLWAARKGKIVIQKDKQGIRCCFIFSAFAGLACMGIPYYGTVLNGQAVNSFLDNTWFKVVVVVGAFLLFAIALKIQIKYSKNSDLKESLTIENLAYDDAKQDKAIQMNQ